MSLLGQYGSGKKLDPSEDGDSVLSGQAIVHKRHSCVDLQNTPEPLFGDSCLKGISIPGIH